MQGTKLRPAPPDRRPLTGQVALYNYQPASLVILIQLGSGSISPCHNRLFCLIFLSTALWRRFRGPVIAHRFIVGWYLITVRTDTCITRL